MEKTLVNQYSFVIDYVEELLNSSLRPEDKARACLFSGQMMERCGDYEVAFECHSRAFLLNPVRDDVWYFLHNNLAYCLNHFGRFEDAEIYCREAIAINASRHNAYKNLEIALAGADHYADAARAFIAAVGVCPRDPRALQFLEALFGSHPEIENEIPDIFSKVEGCRAAVQNALGINTE